MQKLLAGIAVIVCFIVYSYKAEADLIGDLRNGTSDITATSTTGAWMGIIGYWKKQKSAPDFKAIVTARDKFFGWEQAGSAELAVEGAIKYCKEHGGGRTRCEVYAIGDEIVEGYTQAKLAEAIESYNRKLSGKLIKTPPPNNPYIYCWRADGSVYRNYEDCTGTSVEITKNSYDRLSAQAVTERVEGSSTNTIEEKLQKLKELLDKGLITSEEAKAKRSELLNDL